MSGETPIQRGASIRREASKRFERELGYELRDPFEEICEMLGDHEAFSFSRFGDGELNAVFGRDGSNRDGYRYFPELGARLRGILGSAPDYMMGLQPLAILLFGTERISAVAPGVRWVFSGCLHHASMEGRLGAFFQALQDRRTILVGAPHHRRLAEARSWGFVEIPNGDCWPQYERICAALEPTSSSSDAVFLICASMTANVLVDELHRVNPRNTYIDTGSLLDPYSGVNSRSYHEALDPSMLEAFGARDR